MGAASAAYMRVYLYVYSNACRQKSKHYININMNMFWRVSCDYIQRNTEYDK